jgi:hypothetical protein
MPSIVTECPHCGAEKIGFPIIAERRRASIVRTPNVTRSSIWDCLATCSGCEAGVLLVFGHNADVSAQHQSPANCPSDPRVWGYVLNLVLPAPKPSHAPDHLPDPLPNLFLQAADALKRSSWDASGAMSRKTVDVCTKLLMKEEAKQYRDMKPRIDALAASGALTPQLKEWAHQVRLDGNDAVHDEDPFTKDEAEELLDFTELFLTYVYALPGRLAAKKKPHPPVGPSA